METLSLNKIIFALALDSLDPRSFEFNSLFAGRSSVWASRTRVLVSKADVSIKDMTEAYENLANEVLGTGNVHLGTSQGLVPAFRAPLFHYEHTMTVGQTKSEW